MKVGLMTDAEHAARDKDARIAELEEALRWALAEIEGRTRYDTQEQQDNAHECARTALTQPTGDSHDNG